MPHSCTDPNCVGPHTREERDAMIRRHINRHGWTVVGILGASSFAYTIGMTERRWPELLYILDGPGTKETLGQTQRLLNTIGRQLVETGQRPRHNQTVQVTDDAGVKWTYLLETRMDTSLLVQAKAYFRRSVSVLEVVLVD